MAIAVLVIDVQQVLCSGKYAVFEAQQAKSVFSEDLKALGSENR